MPEFFAPFPVARVNFFKVYELCVEILKEIALRYQAKLPLELELYHKMGCLTPPPANACAGYSLVFVLMQDVDSRLDKGSRTIEEHEGVKLVWKAIQKV